MSKIEFLNIDLDLESKDDLSPLIRELGEAVVVMSNEHVSGAFRASFELAGKMGSPEYIFQQYFALLNSLSEEARNIWNNCLKREFDLGFEGGAQPNAIQEKLSVAVLNTLSSLGASIAITIYAASEEQR